MTVFGIACQPDADSSSTCRDNKTDKELTELTMKEDVGSTKKQEYVKEDFFYFKEKISQFNFKLAFTFHTSD